MIKKQHILKKSIDLANSTNWGSLSMQDIAKYTDANVNELQKIFVDKHDIVKAILNDFDKKIEEENFDFDMEFDSKKDRLFEVIMYRFDLLNENRSALISMLSPAMNNPEIAIGYKENFCNSIRIILEKAKITSTNMLQEDVMLAAVATAYMLSVKIWLTDETADMAKTMATLDKYLTKIFKLSLSIKDFPFVKTLWS